MYRILLVDDEILVRDAIKENIEQNKAKIEGDLTLHGVTKPVVLDTTFNKSGPNPFSKTPTIGFSAKASINRSDFGIKYGLPNVGDKIDLIIQVEAVR